MASAQLLLWLMALTMLLCAAAGPDKAAAGRIKHSLKQQKSENARNNNENKKDEGPKLQRGFGANVSVTDSSTAGLR